MLDGVQRKALLPKQTTAHDATTPVQSARRMALNDELRIEPMPGAPNGNGAAAEPLEVDSEASKQPQRSLKESLAEEQRRAGRVKGSGNQAQDGRVDSEAETEILSGKEDDPNHKSRKAIKLEEAPDSHLDAVGSRDRAEQTSPRVRAGARKTSLKRKRGSEQPESGDGKDEHGSSKLSSTISSPVVERRTTDDIDSKSDQSELSPSIEEDTRQRASTSTQRHLDSDKDHKAKHENIKPSVNGGKRRDTRSGTDFEESAHRSISPSQRKPLRAQSTQSNTSQSHEIKKRKKAPAPLYVDRRSRPSEDVHDSDSSSLGDHQPSKIRGVAGESSTMWKGSKVSKTNKDRSGRTRLARACASGVAEDVEKWLTERLEDINVADFAGNTPLQVASLEGYADIVKLLLEAGCSVDSKNVDGDTPLIDAVENGHFEVVRMLLDAGVDPTQRSQSGKEPIELVNAEMEDADEIRAALLASKKERDGRRRQSEDQYRSKMSAPRELEVASTANSGPSPTNSTRSPPLEPGPKRRTARSQHTDDNLLWVNPSPQRLRDAAGKGDIKIVNHILGMTPKADTDAIVAAAQGGHDEVLGLMLAIGNPEADPPPLRSGSLKPGYTTPMLAAIGGSNVKVLDLLVHQPGFDPTRRMHKGLTYFELAKERQGSEWQEEYDLLKGAYDHYKQSGGRRSNHTSPNKVRSRRADSRKSSPEPSSSPHEMRKVRRPQPAVKEEDDSGSKQEPKRRPSYQGTASKRPEEGRKLTSIASDQEASIRAKGKENKPVDRVRSTSPSQPPPKHRRRLMSGNDVKTDQESRKSRNFAAEDKERRRSGDSVDSHGARPRKSSDASTMSAPPLKKASSESPRRMKEESGRKRHRTSTSPQASRSEVTEAMKKKKRPRVDSRDNATEYSLERPARLGPAPPANMLPNAAITSSPNPCPIPASTAPVAFMGSATASPVNKSPVKDSSIEPTSKSANISPVDSIDQTMRDAPNDEDDKAEIAAHEEANRMKQEEEERQRQRRVEQENLARIEAEGRQRVEAEKQAQLQREKEAAEREAQLALEKAEELARQAQDEQRRQREEMEAQAKKRKEEELQKRRAEQERQRKLDQEKRRLEAEQRETAARLKAQQEEEAARRNALPNGLRRYFELTPDQARSLSEIRKWLPLRTVTTEDLDEHAEGPFAQERWIANVQVAPLLANKDLELSQCK